MMRLLGALGALLTFGCGSSPQPALEPASTAASPRTASVAPAAATIIEVAAIEEPPRVLPTSCAAGEGDACSLPADFGERLCAGANPEVALHLFAPKTPWKRAYLKKSFQAWLVGGRGDMRELRVGEEVLIVKTGGRDLTGGQAFDVLRWDGTCVSLMEDEISFKKPSSSAPANIPWKKLQPEYQSAFAEEKQIEAHRANQAKLCEDASADKEPGKSKCEFARRHLSQAIAQAVAKGKALPALRSIP